jgi:two-component system, response regulator PdtaR
MNHAGAAILMTQGSARPPGAGPTGGSERGEQDRGLARRVLLIEDDGLVALSLEAMVEEAGLIPVGIAHSARAGIEAARRLRPDVLIVDVDLGHGVPDGIAAAAEIHREFALPVLFITARSDPETSSRIEALGIGAAVVYKPLRQEELTRALGRL